MWSKGIAYRKREKEKLSKISLKDLPFDVFIKNINSKSFTFII